MEFKFEVDTLEAGQRGSYADSHYKYKVTSSESEAVVETFCMAILKKSHKTQDMPNPFAGEVITFEKLTDNNKDWKFGDERKTEEYSYHVRCRYTG